MAWSWSDSWFLSMFRVESVAIVSLIVHNLSVSVGINPRVATTDVSVSARFLLAFDISGVGIVDRVREVVSHRIVASLVLRIGGRMPLLLLLLRLIPTTILEAGRSDSCHQQYHILKSHMD